MRTILASGPWVNAIKSYDPRLRVRWSFEKKQWCVDYPSKRRYQMLPPVRYKRTPAGWTESLLPEYSERYIAYHSGRDPVIYCGILDRRAVERIRAMDGHRWDDSFLGMERQANSIRSDMRKKQMAEDFDRGAREGYDKMRFFNRKNLHGQVSDTVTTKEEKIAIVRDGEKKMERLLTEA